MDSELIRIYITEGVDWVTTVLPLTCSSGFAATTENKAKESKYVI